MARQKTAYITGAANGVGRALAISLLSDNYIVYAVDLDVAPLSTLATQHPSTLFMGQCDVRSWEEQARSFSEAVEKLGHVDFVAPVAGVGEREFVPAGTTGFEKPDLSLLDVNLMGVLYTVSLAVQQFRRQEVQDDGVRGRVAIVASVCAFYVVPLAPVYSAGKAALVGFTRSYGKLVESEGILVNAVAPNICRTAMMPAKYFDDLETKGPLTPMEGVMGAFEEMARGKESGVVFECGPRGGWARRETEKFMDKESEIMAGLIGEQIWKAEAGE